ncbi:LutC/YkgG family protein [Chthonobacter rhizosphaerae]|uniref:LutC/YkgG family protein n=1 Tax=Chthonobacter rhizosphaerae TaxID=2735553 RepID=UPI0015EED880|nr:lactate utilization protein [Chthonobacter rhizosphaerae]
MTATRDAILNRVRRNLGVSGTDVTRRAAVADRITRAPAGVVPARGQLDPADRVALFVAKAEGVQATTERVASAADVPAAVADFLRRHNLPQRVRIGADPRLAGLDWAVGAGVEVLSGPSDGSDLVCVSHAAAGVAETGTLVLTSGPDNPTTLNFLPDVHVVVVDAGTIGGDYETVWRDLRARLGKGVMPRTVNFVTGPSRSADIEQTLLLGAHGPRSLHVIVTG